MGRSAGLLALVAFACGLTSTAARAQIIDPGPLNWDVPSLIPVVGHDANGVPDPRGEIRIVVRDFANLPVGGVVVVLDFSNCAELSLCADPHDPDATVNCAARTVTKVSAANGEVRFRVVGCSTAAPGGPGSGNNCARIYGDGVLAAFPTVAIYDLTGCDGLAPADLAAWLTDFLAGPGNLGRDDYDGSGSTGPADLSPWLEAFFDAQSVENDSGATCP
jgi:hypothetical protein